MKHVWTEIVITQIKFWHECPASDSRVKLQGYKNTRRQDFQASSYIITSAILSLLGAQKKMAPGSLLSLRLWIAEGLLDDINGFLGTDTLRNVLFPFKEWPHDRGKLIVRCLCQRSQVVRRTKTSNY